MRTITTKQTGFDDIKLHNTQIPLSQTNKIKFYLQSIHKCIRTIKITNVVQTI